MTGKDHTPLEAVMVAAFGFDRPEGVGAASVAANGGIAGLAGTTRPPGDSDASGGRTGAALTAICVIHQREEYGDCVEDGDPWPCKTIRVVRWAVSDAAS